MLVGRLCSQLTRGFELTGYMVRSHATILSPVTSLEGPLRRGSSEEHARCLPRVCMWAGSNGGMTEAEQGFV